MKVDAKSKLVMDFETTAANVHDSQMFKELVDEKDEAVLADSAYLSESAREHLLKNAIVRTLSNSRATGIDH